MEIGVLIFIGFISLVGLLIFKYDKPAKPQKKVTGRGGDFQE